MSCRVRAVLGTHHDDVSGNTCRPLRRIHAPWMNHIHVLQSHSLRSEQEQSALSTQPKTRGLNVDSKTVAPMAGWHPEWESPGQFFQPLASPFFPARISSWMALRPAGLPKLQTARQCTNPNQQRGVWRWSEPSDIDQLPGFFRSMTMTAATANNTARATAA